MGLTLGEVIAGVRQAHPQFDRLKVPDRALGVFLGREQRALAIKATQRNASYLAQRLSVTFDLSSANFPGTVGAGTAGGLPGDVDGSGTVSVIEAPVGNALRYALDEAVEVVAPFAVSSATSLTLTKTGAGRTVNGDANRWAQIVDGPGSGPQAVRRIASNTADTWTLSQAWTVTPTAGASVARIIDAPDLEASPDGAVVGLPAYQQEASYLVRLDASGQPYIDLTKPLLAKFHAGIRLPPFDRLLSPGVCVFTGAQIGSPSSTNGVWERPFSLVHYQNRANPARWPSGYVLGNDLYLIGDSDEWLGTQSIDLRYVPIPDLFPTDSSALATYFLLPDTAYDCLVQWGEARAARWAKANGVDVDPLEYEARARLAEGEWLITVGRQTSQALRTGRRNR